MTAELISPEDIATWLYDSCHIRDKGTKQLLESRIGAWAASQRERGKREGVLAAVRRASATVARIRGASPRATGDKVLRAIEELLQQDAEEGREAYIRGYQDGSRDAVNGHIGNDKRPSTREPRS